MIPNQGFYTLWVLSVGVVVALMLEFVLKQVRSRSVDRACHAMDVTLSGWFFQRMMGVRMESRPASVGSLASQIKGFELVRGILASTSLFVLTDVPFALFFIGVIALVGGWLALIPLLLVPCAVSAGVLFQRAIQRHTRLNLNASHRKTGLLVESVDGAESLKAQGAEWTLLRRWMNLADEAGEADQHIRGLNAWSQNITVALQQLAYVGLVAAGAWLVAHNELTMGGLLACTIISNRAMMPIVQLPGVMVQWAHARAALEGLDQVIRLPNEADDVVHALQPQRVEGSLRFDRVRFAYGVSPRPALELQGLAIKPGERVGVLGAIGSGKSTLLKMASGLYRPAEGRVFIGGLDQSLLSSAVVRSVVGYLPQDARLVSGTLRDNLLQGLPDPGDEVILSAAQRTGLIELINAQPRGLSLPITEGGRGVSGGQKQLIMLTRLLLARPAIWLMDEPTGAMDSMTEAKVVQLLSDVAKDGATVVAATHKTALLPLFDRLIILQNGRVLADGPRDVILAKMQGKAQV
ncbi:MAG: ATP-binding cassette domain-containing protein [Macromonas sp.]